MPSSPRRSTPRDLFTPSSDPFSGPEPDLHTLQNVIEDLRRDPQILRSFLQALLSDDEALGAVAKRSSVHANGFAKIVLHPGLKWSVRLHVWHHHNGRWVPDSMPHGHRWEFASWIVVGALLETTFVESADGVPYDRFAYGRRTDDEAYLYWIGPARLQTVAALVHGTDTIYTRSRSMIHTATPTGDGVVATLVLQGPRQLERTPVYIRCHGKPDPDEWPVSIDRVRVLVAEVSRALL